MGLLPASWALSKSCLCNLQAGREAGGCLWSETAHVLSAWQDASCLFFSPLGMQGTLRLRAEAYELGLPTAPQGGDLYEGLDVASQAFSQP